MNIRAPYRFPLTLLAGLALVLAACSSPVSGSLIPSPSASPSSPSPSATVFTAPAAAQLVLAIDPRFAQLAPHDPAAIGQGSWYEIASIPAGWLVTLQIGWGDCIAGCIYRHTWVYQVDFNGQISLAAENGDPLEATSPAVPVPPPSLVPAPSLMPGPSQSPSPRSTPTPVGLTVPPLAVPTVGGPWLVGIASAGPVCPVERNPPDPACAPRPVSGAAVLAFGPNGAEVGHTTTAADGTYRLAVPAGSVRVEAAPVSGLMGHPAARLVTVPAGPGAWLRVDLDYDTGIR